MGNGDNFSKFAILISIFFIVIAVYITKAFFSVILFSFFIAYLFVPLCSFLEQRTKHRRMSAMASVLLALTIFVLIGIRIIYFIVIEVSTLLNSPENLQSFASNITNLVIKSVEKNVPFIAPEITSQINRLSSDVINAYFPPAKTLVVFLTSTLPFYIVALVVGIMFSYYLLLTGNKLIDQIFNFIPDKREEEVKLFLKELDMIYSGLFRQHFVASAIIGIISFLGLYLLNVPYPGVLASLIFLLSMFPLVGLPAVYLPLTAYYALFQDYSKALQILLFSTALNIVQDYYLRPKLVEKKGSVHPVITILAFGAPLLVVGMTGLVIGPVVYGFLLALYRTKIKLKRKGNGEEQKADSENTE